MNPLCGCRFSPLRVGLKCQLLQEVHLDYVSCISSLSPQHLPQGELFLFFFSVLPVYCYQPISLHPPHACRLSHVIPWTAAHQAPLSMDFSRQEYWNGLPFPFSRVNSFFLFFFFFFDQAACVIFPEQAEPVLPSLGAWSLNHLTTR